MKNVYSFSLKLSCTYLEHFEEKNQFEDKSAANEPLGAAERVPVKNTGFRNSLSINSSNGTLWLLCTNISPFSPNPITTKENLFARLAVFLLILRIFPFLFCLSQVVLES